MASTEPPQGQLKRSGNLVPWVIPFEMLFLLFTIYSAGGNIEEGGFPIPGANLFLKQGLRLKICLELLL